MVKKNEDTKNENDPDHDKENDDDNNNNNHYDQEPRDHDQKETTDEEDDEKNDDDDDDDDFESVIQGEGELVMPYAGMNRKKKKALLELRCRVEDAILGNYLLGKPNLYLSNTEIMKQKEVLREITLWGVPLLPSKGHEGTEIVLLKLLRASDFRVHDAFQMLRRNLKWRKEYKADEILEEKFGPGVEKVLFVDSRDREGRPLCYSVYGAFRDGGVYERAFGSEQKCEEFLRWRIQCVEKGIKELEFKNGGVNSIVLISDFKNSPWPVMKELRPVSKKALILLQENYPELIHEIIVINAPLWYHVMHSLRSRFLTQKTKRKFVLVRATKVAETLLKVIAAESLPVQYGGLKRENDGEFSPLDVASELKIKGNSTAYIEFPVSQAGLTMVWDLSVIGWNVSYKEEFVPDDEGSYKILLQNQKRMGESLRNSFYISEPGKILITIENGTFKKKRALYRFKAKPTVPMYIFLKK